jgi:hypothetical protein
LYHLAILFTMNYSSDADLCERMRSSLERNGMTEYQATLSLVYDT